MKMLMLMLMMGFDRLDEERTSKWRLGLPLEAFEAKARSRRWCKGVHLG